MSRVCYLDLDTHETATPVYELWDTDSHALILAARCEDAILAAIEEFLDGGGEEAAIGLVLLRDDRSGGAKEPMGADAELGRRALALYAER